MLPKNVRQIGQIEGNKRIYIEDYVMTYARKIEGMAVLLGKQEEEGEEQVLYISGAVNVKNVAYGYPTSLKNEDWSEIYEDVKTYFSNLEIMGWLLVRENVVLEIDEEIRRIHEENFKGANKILFLYDKQEKEESFYLSNRFGELKKQMGYYIFYEKNDSMQSYMMEKNPQEKVEEEIKDDAMVKVREIIAKKEPQKNEKKMMNLMYGASTLLAAVVLVIGATMLDNYDKMKNMEETLSVISDTLDQGKTEEESVVEVEKINGNTQTVEPEEIKTEETDDKETPKEIEKAEEETPESKEEDTTKKPEEETEKPEEADTENDTEHEKTDTKKPEENTDSDTKPTIATEKKNYIVQEGDTLASISYKLYQSYDYVKKIQNLNEIENSDMIYTGQKLQLP